MQLDLLMLSRHKLGRDAIEKIFFGNIDGLGANARDQLPRHGQVNISSDRRIDWARVLLSLEARRPAVVERLKEEGAEYLRDQLDKDAEIQEALKNEGYTESASVVAAAEMGINFTDRALMAIQDLVDNPNIGGRLINAIWFVRRLPFHCRKRFVISDQPLIRFHAFDSAGAVWLVPISPRAVFIGAAHENNLNRLLRLRHEHFCNILNNLSVRQADAFVFSTSQHEACWLETCLLGATSRAA